MGTIITINYSCCGKIKNKKKKKMFHFTLIDMKDLTSFGKQIPKNQEDMDNNYE